MEKAYDHNGSEDEIYAAWEASGAMRANEHSDKPPFTIPLPPPNVTGNLHLGHAAMLAIEDIMIRYKRMRGHEVLWVPGTDHAAIATENVVLRHLGAKSREEYSREDFLGHCRSFAAEKHDNIVNQMKKMGSWLDWSREAYTFDEARNGAVNVIFKQLYEDGLIERGHRLINWSVGAQSVLSDDELEYDEVKEPFYYIRCGEFVIGTVRPETKCADSPVVVHPESNYVTLQYGTERLIVIENLWLDQEKFFKTLNFLNPEADYKVVDTKTGAQLEGLEFEYDTYAGKRKFYVLADEVIDPEKGAGAMTISSSHSADDYDLAKRKDLKETFIQKVDFAGKMTAIAGPCEGLDLISARKKSGKLMEEMGLLLGKDNNYQHRVPLCYRSNCVVEPMISPQWFIMVEKEYTHPVDGKTTLKKQMQAAVRENHVKIVPERFNKEYFRWIDNLQDWCISRQIWWGHRIPVWYDDEGNTHLPKSRNLICVRHGQSLGNFEKRGQYSEDPLTESGIADAKKSGERLKAKNITTIVTSPAKRAYDTAKIIAEEIGFTGEITVWEDFSEFDIGDDLRGAEKPQDKTIIEQAEINGNGENRTSFFARMTQGWRKLMTLSGEGDVLLVSHRTNFSAFDAIRTGGDEDVLIENRKKNDNASHGIWGEFEILTAPEGENLRQDEDTLDTWFSSALWPFSTLGWPDKNAPDFKKFYQTDVLETGWDILFFWVARMIMFGRYATGEYPFHTVYLHGMVTDEHGKKMSKSKGNGIDPIGMIEQFGADPVRLALVIGSSPGNPIPIGENKIKGYRNFVNKLWNATRFVQMQTTDVVLSADEIAPKSLADRWLLSRLTTVTNEVAAHLNNYEISSAGDKIYHFVWGEFCDWYLEASKADMSPEVLKFALGEILKLTHPLCPFITEKLWQENFKKAGSLMDENFPELSFKDEAAEKDFTQVQNIVSAIRQLRADKKLNPKDKIAAFAPAQEKLANSAAVISLLANLSSLTLEKAPDSAIKLVVDGIEIFVDIPVDEAAEANRIAKEKAELEAQIKNLEGRLANKSYTEKAPPHLVAQTQEALNQARDQLSKII